MNDVNATLKANVELEQQIKDLRQHTSSKEHTQEIAHLFSKVRAGYRRLIVECTSTLAVDKKDVDGLMWKSCFYKQIEDFRKSIKKHSVPVESSQFALVEKQRIYLSKLTSALLKFLSDSVVFYQTLMVELEERVGEMRKKGHNDSDKVLEHTLRCIYKCLLYLGDLVRYKEIYSDREVKDFSEARRYYERAAIIIPNSGNAQNQLAVLATYNRSECVAVYHYCRSILVQQPFTGGLENLSLLFSKNATVFAQLMKENDGRVERSHQSGGRDRDGRDKGKKQQSDSARMRAFLTKFVRLHGMMFEWATRMHKESASVPSSMQSASSNSTTTLPHQNTATKPIDIDEYISTLHGTLDDFDFLLSCGASASPGESPLLSDSLLLQLLVMCMFSIHFGVPQEENLVMHSLSFSSAAYDDDAAMGVVDPLGGGATRTVTESLGLITLFGFVNRAATKINNMLNSSAVNAEKREKDGRRQQTPSAGSYVRLYPLLSVFCDWATLYPHYLLVAKPPSTSTHSTGLTIFQSDQNLLMSEGRARSGMRATMSALKPGLQSDMRRYEDSSPEEREGSAVLLTEHVELRGFLPLNARYDKLFVGFDPLARTKSTASDKSSRYVRQSAVHSFVDEVLEPMAAQEATEADLRRQARVQSHAAVTTPGPEDRSEGREHHKRGGKLFDPNAGSTPTKGTSGRDRERERASQRKNRDSDASPAHGNNKRGGYQEAVSGGHHQSLPRLEDFPVLPGTEGHVRREPPPMIESNATYYSEKEEEEEQSPMELEDDDEETYHAQQQQAYLDRVSGRLDGIAPVSGPPPQKLVVADILQTPVMTAPSVPFTIDALEYLSHQKTSEPVEEEEEYFEDEVVFRPAFSRSVVTSASPAPVVDVLLPQNDSMFSLFSGGSGNAHTRDTSFDDLLGLAAEHTSITSATGDDLFASLGRRSLSHGSRLNQYTSSPSPRNHSTDNGTGGLGSTFGSGLWGGGGGDVLFPGNANLGMDFDGQVDTFSSLFDDVAPPAAAVASVRSENTSTPPRTKYVPPGLTPSTNGGNGNKPTSGPPGLNSAGLPTPPPGMLPSGAGGSNKKPSAGPPGLAPPPPPPALVPVINGSSVKGGALKTANPFYRPH